MIVIAGSTASGKTELGLRLAGKLGGEVISADSRMVYQGLDIGTGKPTWEYCQLARPPWIKASRQTVWGPIYTISGVDHHLLDIVPPETRFTLTDWLSAARAAMADIHRRGRRLIVVGGTGLYLKALTHGYTPPPTDVRVRSAIEQLSTPQILEELRKFDPETADRESKNRRRLIRALEVVHLTGRPLGSFSNTSEVLPRHLRGERDATVWAIDWPRPELYRRIDQRTREQLAGGLVEEVARLLAEGHKRSRRDVGRVEWLRSIGLEYRIVTDWFLSQPEYLAHPLPHLRSVRADVQEFEERLRGAIHAYARRQLTYLRHQLPVRWLPPAAIASFIHNS